MCAYLGGGIYASSAHVLRGYQAVEAAAGSPRSSTNKHGRAAGRDERRDEVKVGFACSHQFAH
eukprot:330158-Alexandrium_andersonii.AAC.1